MDTLEIGRPVALDELIKAPNVCDLLDADDVKNIGLCCQQGYNEDRASRKEWEERSARAMKLALQVVEPKTFPWAEAANVKFPAVTVAAIQYHARAYPALISGTDLVKCRVIGEDPKGLKADRAYRLSTHMSWQCLEQDVRWEEEHDKLLLVQGIAGCGFVKKLWDPTKGHNVSSLVLPGDFVVNYYTKDLDSSPRYTHRFLLTENVIRQREMDGRYSEEPIQQQNPAQNQLDLAKDEREGLRPPPQTRTTPYETGEQYNWLDLDGDGYCEPYIVTFDVASSRVRSIVARFLPSGVKKVDGKVYEITPVKVFTKYGFIPSPDGGFYDLGLGMLLGPLNESINTALNQIFDAGTMATLGGGFVGRGFKGRGGPFSFKPFEWFPIDAPGDDLRKNILPLPVREPSTVLFQVLGLLIQYGERIVGATDIQMGENPGQNTPAETTRTLNANGARVYNAIYKRTWRAMRDEFRIQYDLNKLFISADVDYEDLTKGQGALIRPDDYQGTSLDVKPAADPYIVSDTERVDRAAIVFKNAMTVPGHNRYQATLRLYRAMQISNIDEILPPPMTQGPDGKPQPAADFPPPPDPKMMDIQIKQGKLQLDQQQFMADQQEHKIQLQMQIQESFANVNKLQAQAALFTSQAKGAEVEPIIKMIYAQIESEGQRQDKLLRLVELVDAQMERINSGNGKNGRGRLAPVEAAPQNPGILVAPQAIGGNGQGPMAGGGLPLQ